MKIWSIVMVINFALISALYGATYLPIAKTSDISIFVDKESIHDDKDSVNVIYIIQSNKKEMTVANNKNLTRVDYYAKFDCLNKKSFTYKIGLHSVDGILKIIEQSKKMEYVDIKNGGNTEAVYNYICGYNAYDKNDKAHIGLMPINNTMLCTIGPENGKEGVVKYLIGIYSEQLCKNDRQCKTLENRINKMIEDKRPVIELKSYLDEIRIAWKKCNEEADTNCEHLSERYLPGGL